jgi:hypothetical protein
VPSSSVSSPSSIDVATSCCIVTVVQMHSAMVETDTTYSARRRTPRLPSSLCAMRSTTCSHSDMRQSERVIDKREEEEGVRVVGYLVE